VTEQIARVLIAPQPLSGIERDRWHHQMYVWVEIQPTVMGMQHGHRARSPTQFFVVLAEGVDGLPRAAGDQVGYHTLMSPGQRTKLCGQSECDHEILTWHQFLQLLVNPVLRFVGLTMRVVPVATGMRYPAFLFAAVTGAAAQLERAQRFALAGQQFVTVLFEQGGRVLRHNIGEAHHATLFQPT